MTSETSNFKYTILPITEEHKQEVLHFLKGTFFPHEPVNEGVGLCANGERCPDLEEYCLHDMLSGFSLRAIDDEGNIVAVIVNGISSAKETAADELLKQAVHCSDPKFQKVLHVLAQRERAARLWEKYPGERLLEVKVAATDPGWGKRGLMTALVAHTERLAQAANITLIRMDTSSAYSARAAEKLGFTCLSSLLYKDIKLNGEVLTSPPQPHVEDRVNVKKISTV